MAIIPPNPHKDQERLNDSTNGSKNEGVGLNLNEILSAGGSTRDVATALIEAGAYPVPIPKGQKGPQIKKWEEREFSPTDFKPDMNIGLHNINIASVDRDCEEAYVLRNRFLPRTFRTGRASKPESHSHYAVAGAPAFLQLKDGQMMVELRYGRGKQTVIPPSIHPEGEPYVVFDPEQPVATITAEALERGVRLEAAACLIARHYAPPGGQYDFGLALAGYLLRHGVSEDEAFDLMMAAKELQPEGVDKDADTNIRRVVETTAETLKRGKNVTGGKRLKEEGHGDLVAKLPRILGWETQHDSDELSPEELAAAAWADERVRALAGSQDILAEVYKLLQQGGLVGEEQNAKLLGLVSATRHLGELMSVIIGGESSGGKSYLIKQITKTLPEEFYYKLQSVSDKALAYIGENTLTNRFLQIYELGGMGKEGEQAIEMAKQLLTEGSIERQIAESTGKGVVGRKVKTNGPTGLWTTTTRTIIDAELKNRALGFEIDESPEQTARIIKARRARKKKRKGGDVDYAPVQGLHRWLAVQQNDVVVPFEDAVVEQVDTTAVRMRRYYEYLMTLVEAHAVLHQKTRKLDVDGWIVAELADYAGVYPLVNKLLGEAAEVAVSETVRETVKAAREIIEGPKPLTRGSLAEKLGITPQTAGRRLGGAQRGGYIKPDPDSNDRKTKVYVMGEEALPDEGVSAIPTPEDVEAAFDPSEEMRTREPHEPGGGGSDEKTDENANPGGGSHPRSERSHPEDEKEEPHTYAEYEEEEGAQNGKPPDPADRAFARSHFENVPSGAPENDVNPDANGKGGSHFEAKGDSPKAASPILDALSSDHIKAHAALHREGPLGWEDWWSAAGGVEVIDVVSELLDRGYVGRTGKPGSKQIYTSLREPEVAERSVVYAGKGGPFDVSHPGHTYVGRQETRGGNTYTEDSPYCNPFKVDKPGTKTPKRDGTLKEVLDKFDRYLDGPVENHKGKVFDGRGLVEKLKAENPTTLGCWCADKDGKLTAGGPPICHGQVLLRRLKGGGA